MPSSGEATACSKLRPRDSASRSGTCGSAKSNSAISATVLFFLYLNHSVHSAHEQQCMHSCVCTHVCYGCANEFCEELRWTVRVTCDNVTDIYALCCSASQRLLLHATRYGVAHLCKLHISHLCVYIHLIVQQHFALLLC